MLNRGASRQVWCLGLILGVIVSSSPVAADRDQKGQVRATGTVQTAAPPLDLSTRALGDLEIIVRAGPVSAYEGDLQGMLACTTNVFRNRTTGVMQSVSAICNFTGTVAGSPPGAMTKIWTRTLDPAFLGTPLEGSGRWMAGVGGLKGICGEGSFWNPVPGGAAEYDYTFRFGKACKANDGD